MLDKTRARRKRKNRPTGEEEIPLLDFEPAREFFQSLKARLPGLKEQFGPILSKTGEKLGDAYSSVAQVLAAQKEALEDRFAERRSRASTSHPKTYNASGSKHAGDGEV